MGTRKERLEAAGSISEKILGWKCSVEGQRVYTHESEGQKTNSGLDKYEGFFPLHPERSSFVRAVTSVVMDDGREKEAWVYFYNGPVDESKLIAGGDYRSKSKQRFAGTRRVG